MLEKLSKDYSRTSERDSLRNFDRGWREYFRNAVRNSYKISSVISQEIRDSLWNFSRDTFVNAFWTSLGDSKNKHLRNSSRQEYLPKIIRKLPMESLDYFWDNLWKIVLFTNSHTVPLEKLSKNPVILLGGISRRYPQANYRDEQKYLKKLPFTF